jgi:predicted transcriptional regulator
MDSDELSLSLTEWQLMSALWDLRTADAQAVSETLRAKYHRFYSPKTTGIMLSRLEDKGFLRSLAASSSGPGRPANLYSPVLPRDLAVKGQFRRFLTDHSIQQPDYELLLSVLTSPAS